jgi:Nif-specific regulatory protein
VIAGSASPREVEVQDDVVIGRARECDVCVLDETTSRRHARVALRDGRAVLEDLGSANGTRLNAEPVKGPAVLFDGDVIEVGSVRLRFATAAAHDRPTAAVPASSEDADVEAVVDPERADPAREARDERAARRLRLVCEGAAACADAASPDEVPSTLLALVVETFAPDRASVCLRGPGGALEVAAGHPAGAAPPSSRTLRRRVLDEGEAVLVRDAHEGGTAPTSLVRSRHRSTMAAPLATAEGIAGCVAVEATEPGRYGEDDLRALAAACRQAALALRNLRTLSGARAEVRRLSGGGETESTLVGASPAIESARASATKAAAADVPVLVTGETGTGKELIARMVHALGPRRSRPFVALNCAALVEGLLESEMFGHEKGAFTGAHARRDGRIAEAANGTLFLDEVGDLPAPLQAKLLRVLSERTYTRVGGSETLRMECRVVAATHRDLSRRVAEGAFREDLFYRLAVLVIDVPPLRERPEDVEAIAEAALERIAARLGRPVPRLADDARAALRAYRWPGNVRELFNVLERAVVLLEGDTITAAALPSDLRTPAPDVAALPGSEGVLTLREAEKRAVRAALAATEGRKGAAAALLGISWPTLNRKIREYGLSPPAPRDD